MADFIRIYCILDVLLLVEIWSNFIDFCQKNYNLNPEFFHTLPGFGLECAYLHLFKQNIYIENVQDLRIHDYLRNTVRGGLATTGASRLEFSKKFHEIPEKYFEDLKSHLKILSGEKMEEIEKTIDFLKLLSSKPTQKTILAYLDANNLYGGIMSLFLPLNKLRFVTEFELYLISVFFSNHEKKIRMKRIMKNY